MRQIKLSNSSIKHEHKTLSFSEYDDSDKCAIDVHKMCVRHYIQLFSKERKVLITFCIFYAAVFVLAQQCGIKLTVYSVTKREKILLSDYNISDPCNQFVQCL